MRPAKRQLTQHGCLIRSWPITPCHTYESLTIVLKTKRGLMCGSDIYKKNVANMAILLRVITCRQHAVLLRSCRIQDRLKKDIGQQNFDFVTQTFIKLTENNTQ